LIYRHYATLYFIFAVDEAESELGILDLIQVFVEALDKCFENVCELDLIFHIDKSQHTRTGAQIVQCPRMRARQAHASERASEMDSALTGGAAATAAAALSPSGFTSSSTRS